MNIPFMRLDRQFANIRQEVLDVTESVFKHGKVLQGPEVGRLEGQLAELFAISNAVTVGSGTDALIFSLKAIGLKPKAKVAVTSLSFVASATCIVHTGGIPIFVDIGDAYLTDRDALLSLIRNRAVDGVIAVHLYGQMMDLEEIYCEAKKRGIFVIEDAAQSLYSKNESGFLGTQSKIGCFSVGMTKLISVGQGGVLVTNDKDIYEKIILIRNNGVADISKDTSVRFGLNFKFNDILASIGIEQIELIENRAERVNEIYKKYEYAIENLSTIKIIPVNIAIGEVALWVQVICRNRDNLIKYLSNNSIETRVFLPNLDSVQHISNKSNFPLSKIFSEQGLYLPCGPSQSNKDIDQVLDALKNYTEQD